MYSRDICCGADTTVHCGPSCRPFASAGLERDIPFRTARLVSSASPEALDINTTSEVSKSVPDTADIRLGSEVSLRVSPASAGSPTLSDKLPSG